VLYFEGDRGHQFRILRAVKNRYGATDEIGVFEMTDIGLAEVANPSALFLAERRGNIAGSAVFAGLEGTRPVLVEVQALLAANPGGSPRRQVIGWDGGRLSMLLAVLESRSGVRLNQTDVYLNIAGGLRVTEPAADLAVAAAIASAAFETPNGRICGPPRPLTIVPSTVTTANVGFDRRPGTGGIGGARRDRAALAYRARYSRGGSASSGFSSELLSAAESPCTLTSSAIRA